MKVQSQVNLYTQYQQYSQQVTQFQVVVIFKVSSQIGIHIYATHLAQHHQIKHQVQQPELQQKPLHHHQLQQVVQSHHLMRAGLL